MAEPVLESARASGRKKTVFEANYFSDYESFEYENDENDYSYLYDEDDAPVASDLQGDGVTEPATTVISVMPVNTHQPREKTRAIWAVRGPSFLNDKLHHRRRRPRSPGPRSHRNRSPE